jgi:hypothetical protein
LAASCPVPYLSEAAVPRKLVAEEHAKLEAYNFKVIIDGLELRKPVNLHGNLDGYTTTPIPSERLKIYGRDVAFHGYTVVQEGRQLRPDELRGILIRIKNVAIGYYDPTFLDYRINQGPRSRWLTGEILVDEGLEDALNVDRDSFNRFHPEFRAVQEYVHKMLSSEVFPQVYKKIGERSYQKSEVKHESQEETLKDVVSEVTELPVKLRRQKQPSADADQFPSVEVNDRGKDIEIVIPSVDLIPTRKGNKHLATSIMAIYEIALREKTRDKQRQLFTQLLFKLLARW